MGFTLGFRLHWLRQPGKSVACLTDRCFWSNDLYLHHPVEWRDGIVRCRGQFSIAGPGAAGTVIACPERNVGCLEGDGSAMYTMQALCPMAREALDDTVVIFKNREVQHLGTSARPHRCHPCWVEPWVVRSIGELIDAYRVPVARMSATASVKASRSGVYSMASDCLLSSAENSSDPAAVVLMTSSGIAGRFPVRRETHSMTRAVGINQRSGILMSGVRTPAISPIS
ncbi:hypothetical protein C0029_09685 [Halioglobus japonicus]|uniref:Thiamine pyrophosphate enzyme TPP-binding domain-containing protein n=1 Tax=Halioglobus japonicus TaxID=930805 RepID=A0AAP8MFT5_9GAMM|nr:hypothetical protein C0029_09685 [Halioglobus japonicus]